MWTTTELRILRENADAGALELALLLGRSVQSVKLAAHRQRVSLRRAGEHRGLVLGQALGMPMPPEIREDLVSGRVDAGAVAERMRTRANGDLCPSCGRRPVEVASPGFCNVCHMELLTAAHLAELEKIDAQRALWSSRQALCRARRTAGS